MLLGAIADDLTGATDLALMLARSGMRTLQVQGVPEGIDALPDADAIVVALKSRTIPAARAVDMSLAAARILREGGARQLFFKYCSTFDSTDDGNIGPVAEALLDFLDAPFTIACPAFPATGRSLYQGYLFVGDQLLSDSPMRDHPLTPMRDSSLVRVLDRQCRNSGSVGLVPFAAVSCGSDAIAAAFADLQCAGKRFAIVDAIVDDHLHAIGHACDGLPLITGGSGVAMGLAENFRKAGHLETRSGAAELPALAGPVLVLSGSCSAATNRQVAAMAEDYPTLRLDPLALHEGEQSAAKVIEWWRDQRNQPAALIASTAPPDSVRRAQERLGRDQAASMIEQTFAAVAEAAVAAGLRKLIVAGGETAGAVVGALGVTALKIGPEIDPGVPWTVGVGEPALCLALKSGNFGGDDFFTKAMGMLP